MAETLSIDLVSPERLVASEVTEMAVIPGSEGEMGVMANHAPVISSLKPGIIRLYDGGQITKRYFVAGGFAEINPAGVTILAEEAVDMATVEKLEAEERVVRAEHAVTGAESPAHKAQAEAELAAAKALLAGCQ